MACFKTCPNVVVVVVIIVNPICQMSDQQNTGPQIQKDCCDRLI